MSWKQYFKAISEVCEVIAGQSPESKFYNKEGEGLPFYQGKKQFTKRYIGEPTTWTTKVTKEAFPNDILMSVRAPVGPINISNQRICIGRGLAAIRASEKVDNDYLFYFLLKHEAEIVGNIGAVFNSINKKQIGNIQIPIPPLPEQKQIVTLLDSAFAKIDQAKANIEKNIANAKELFQSKLNRTFETFNANFGSKKLGELLELLTDYHANGSYKVLKQNVELKDEEDYAWMVRSTDFEKNFKNNFKYIDKHAYNYLKKSKIYGGEIIISKIGNAGKVYVMPQIERPCSLAMNLFLLRLNKSEMSSKFLYYYLKTTKGENQILSKLNGTTTKTITKNSVRDLNIPNVEIRIQNQKILEFEKLKEETEELKSYYQKKLNKLDDLKKSLLQKAFAGELTQTAVPS